jgi:PAS domain S-box-containing protein
MSDTLFSLALAASALVALAAGWWALSLRRALVAARSAESGGEAVPLQLLSPNMWEWDMASGRVLVAEQMLEALGMTREEFGTSLDDFLSHVHADDRERVRRMTREYRLGPGDRDLLLELRVVGRQDKVLWITARGRATEILDGHPSRVVGTYLDITSRVEAEEERDRLFNLSIDMLAVGDFDRYLLQINPAWVRVLGWARDDLMGEPITAFVHPDDRADTEAAFEQLVHGDPVYGLENRFRCRDGAYRWLSWSSFPYPDRRSVFSVVRDITREKEDERQLLEYQERLRGLSNQLALVEDRERRQLADAIHDGLAQQLFGIRAQVTLLKYPDKLADHRESVEEILSIIDDTMRDARSLSFELFPPVLYEVGLGPALELLTHQFGMRTGLECTLQQDEEPEVELLEDRRAMAYQSVRELLNNVSKHAQAQHVAVRMTTDAECVTITVDDDGIGCDASATDARDAAAGGFGLFSMRERLRSVGGSLVIGAAPGGGTRVTLSIPTVHVDG